MFQHSVGSEGRIDAAGEQNDDDHEAEQARAQHKYNSVNWVARKKIPDVACRIAANAKNAFNGEPPKTLFDNWAGAGHVYVWQTELTIMWFLPWWACTCV